MERVIDRSCYRRNNEQIKPNISKEIKKHKYLKKFLVQLLAGVFVVLMVAILKLVNEEKILTWIEKEIKKEMTVSMFLEEGQKTIEDMKIYLKKNINEQSTTYEEQENIKPEIQDVAINISSLSTEEPYQIKYEEAVEGINQLIEDSKYIKENYNFKIPLRGEITSTFGVRNSDNPIVSSYHTGTDIAANTGTAIVAALSGEVIKAQTDVAYGKYIIIQTDNIKTLYAHCSKLNVKVGQKIKQGQTIAYVGSTGYSTGPHLHFEIRYNDRFVNPEDILKFN